MTWQKYCAKYEVLLYQNSELAAIRQELFFRLKANKFKAFIKAIFILLKFSKYLFNSTKIENKEKYDNVYFIDSSTSANLGTLKPLCQRDKKKTLLIVNTEVLNSNSFITLKNRNKCINYDKYLKLNIKDIRYIIKKSFYVSRYLEISFYTVFVLLLRMVINRNSLQSIFSTIEAKNILTSNDTNMYSSIAINIAKEINLNNYTLQHGFLTHFYIPTTATNYIVWGQKAKEWFENKKISSKVLSLGTPRLDKIESIKQNTQSIKDKFYKKFNIQKSKKIFFYMSHSQAPEFGIELHKKNFEALQEVIKDKSYQLVIKLHPSESQKLFDEVFISEKENIILLPKEENLYHSIVSSTICASAYSTTLVEAMCFEKPTLQMNLAKIEELPDYSIKEGCVSVQKMEELILILQQVDFKDEINRQNIYVNSYFDNLGNSAESILRYIGKQND
ncbi:hypothetical protein HOK00_00195 [bacterium]|jgi:hypothetical protein|nr:hypothetical protein [bacterium]